MTELEEKILESFVETSFYDPNYIFLYEGKAYAAKYGVDTLDIVMDDIKDLIHTEAQRMAEEMVKIDENTSDGYHTFKELYEYRKIYNALWFNQLALEIECAVLGGDIGDPDDYGYKVVKSKKHSDGELCFGGGWFIVVVETPYGQISNHYELKDWDLFKIPEVDLPPTYDGHTPQQALERMKQILSETPLEEVEK